MGSALITCTCAAMTVWGRPITSNDLLDEVGHLACEFAPPEIAEGFQRPTASNGLGVSVTEIGSGCGRCSPGGSTKTALY